jgi:hypothetical protein
MFGIFERAFEKLEEAENTGNHIAKVSWPCDGQLWRLKVDSPPKLFSHLSRFKIACALLG